MKIIRMLLASFIALGASALAIPPSSQAQNTSTDQSTQQTQATMAVEPMNPTPTFRVTVISRTARAVNYKHRGGATKLDFAGTDLMPKANGEAKVGRANRATSRLKWSSMNSKRPRRSAMSI